MRRVALFVPCFVDQLVPRVGIASLELLERLGLEVVVHEGAACCGQPAANAGFERRGAGALRRLVEVFAECERVVVPSGSCALHVRTHAGSFGAAGARVAERTVELTTFLHDELGPDTVAALGAVFPHRVALHIGCHALRGLGVARPTEVQSPPFDKLRALLERVEGISFAEVRRADECCGFGGTFSVSEPAVSARMGRDRLRDLVASGADAVVSTDVSCLLHLDGLARRAGPMLHMLHVSEVLVGIRSVPSPASPPTRVMPA